MSTKIEWAEATWNPIIGCSKISPGCQNCYAEKMAYRLACMDMAGYNKGVVTGRKMDGEKNFSPRWTGKTALVESALDKPLKRRKPTLYFVCSMGDLFHESVPVEWIQRVWGIMAQARWHHYMVLTKRPWRMKQLLEGATPNPNIALGVTAEDQERANERITALLDTPAAHRFVSVEPMLGPVSLGWATDMEIQRDALVLSRLGATYRTGLPGDMAIPKQTGTGKYYFVAEGEMAGAESVVSKLDLVICGGETGPGARIMRLAWARGLRDQCAAAGVSFMFKRIGTAGISRDYLRDYARLLDGEEHNGAIQWRNEA